MTLFTAEILFISITFRLFGVKCGSADSEFLKNENY